MKINPRHLACYPTPLRLGIFILLLLALWIPFALPIYLLGSNSNLISITTLVLLYGEFICLVRWWGKKVYRQPQILRRYGLTITRDNAIELLQGLGIGSVSIFSLFVLEGGLGWLVWQKPEVFLPQIIFEGLLVAIAIGYAEELLFRGWLLDELQRDYRLGVSLWLNAIIFALLHFIKPIAVIIRTWLQFPGLILLGLALVWAKRSCRSRLGLPIGIHAGLVWGYYMINVGELVQYTGRVPEWITGVDRNPLAGVMGLVFLGSIAFWMQRRSLAYFQQS